MITVTAAADPLPGARRLFKKEARALGRVRGDHDDEDEESTPISLRLSSLSRLGVVRPPRRQSINQSSDFISEHLACWFHAEVIVVSLCVGPDVHWRSVQDVAPPSHSDSWDWLQQPPTLSAENGRPSSKTITRCNRPIIVITPHGDWIATMSNSEVLLIHRASVPQKAFSPLGFQ